MLLNYYGFALLYSTTIGMVLSGTVHKRTNTVNMANKDLGFGLLVQFKNNPNTNQYKKLLRAASKICRV